MRCPHTWWHEIDLEAVTIVNTESSLLAMLPHSTMISSNQGILVSGGQFIQYNYHGQTSQGNKAPMDILMEAVAPNAFHDSGASFDKPKCHPQTRLKILEIIMRWIVGQDEDAQARKPFLWLNGAAGCGKSTIAQSTIESCIGRGVLLASFFFSRSDSTRNHAGPLVATLAYQLYGAFPGSEVQKDILSAIQKDPLIFKKTIQQQITALVIQPLMTHFSNDPSSQNRAPFLIVIDGLDECINRTAQQAVLTGLAESLRNSDLCVQLFIASRPEHDIKLSFSSNYLEDMHTGLSLDLEDGDDAESDIRLYLFDRFAQIKDDFNKRTTGRKLDQDWPGDKVIETLVLKSSRQFIYAATVIRYVESTRHRPDHRLDIVLNLRPVNGDHPFAELDSLYARILESALDIGKVLRVLSLCLISPPRICCSVIEKLLSYDEGEVETLFCDMGALVQIFKLRPLFNEDREYEPELSPSFLRILHASLGEYLLDAARSKCFHINMDYETIRHVTLVLQYCASSCSSSFNPDSNAGTPILILGCNQYRIGRHNGRSAIWLKLQRLVLSFPLKEFLEPHATATRAYPYLLQDFVSPFLFLLETIVLKDNTSSYMQSRQLEILRSILMQQISQYFNDDMLASVLVLFYHAGSHHLVPILKLSPYSYSYSSPFYLVGHDHHSDILSLSFIWGSPFGDNTYHWYVRRWLRDPGPSMHERAALACFEELARTVPPLSSSSAKSINLAPVTDDVEDDIYAKLSFNPVLSSQWQFKYSEELKLDNEELYFVLIGYVIFLLPRCGRSNALVAACEEYRTLYIKQPVGPFPIRSRLLHKEINDYIARVLPTAYCLSRV
ncbi:hypothetical protein D9613_006344 [Agrocybe pediades]|uniref:Nephrocystin 3-like N-terminal domain-containing protein n=1 Tax=Agrocybe pediades TaxID=84607 RepID=A0A8H4QW10_9AGAR|nr:hypothetical protein D9613_006344 [Agrocybe pediades]